MASSVNFFSSSAQTVNQRAGQLADFGRNKKDQVAAASSSVFKENMNVFWQEFTMGGELRIDASNRFYLLPKAEGLSGIFQRIRNAFRKIYVEKWFESSVKYNERFTVQYQLTVNPSSLKHLFYTSIFQDIRQVATYYHKTSLGQKFFSGVPFEGTVFGKFLKFMQKLEKSGMPWEPVAPPSVISQDVSFEWPSLIHRYIFQPNGDLRTLWIYEENGQIDGLYPRAQ